jgi:hypothetical protein
LPGGGGVGRGGVVGVRGGVRALGLGAGFRVRVRP